jgi:hypothetical protein
MEAKAKQGSKSLVSLGMGFKPRHAANVVLGCAILVEHALDHGVYHLPLMPCRLLLAVHEFDFDLILMIQRNDSRKNENRRRPQAN